MNQLSGLLFGRCLRLYLSGSTLSVSCSIHNGMNIYFSIVVQSGYFEGGGDFYKQEIAARLLHAVQRTLILSRRYRENFKNVLSV